MSEKIIVYQKPTCSKCREVLKELKARGLEFEAVNYYEKPFTAEQFSGVLAKAGLGPREVLRKDEPVARSLGILKSQMSDEELVKVMVQNPDLIQRPIVVHGDKAVLARPSENLDRLFPKG